MEKRTLHTWTDLEKWAGQYKDQNRYVFRGQGDNAWHLTTSLARHFIANKVVSNEWRRRELKMYCMFRERLLNICPGMYNDWKPIDILSLMQHHGTPTRLLDFTHSPLVAAYFALRDARGNSTIWVIDSESPSIIQNSRDLETWSWPTHMGGYKIAEKHSGAVILTPSYPHLRLAAQRGCFLVPGHISGEIGDDVICEQVILSEVLVIDSIVKLRGLGIDDEFLFPNLDKVAQETNRFSVTGSADFPSIRAQVGNGSPSSATGLVGRGMGQGGA